MAAACGGWKREASGARLGQAARSSTCCRPGSAGARGSRPGFPAAAQGLRDGAGRSGPSSGAARGTGLPGAAARKGLGSRLGGGGGGGRCGAGLLASGAALWGRGSCPRAGSSEYL